MTPAVDVETPLPGQYWRSQAHGWTATVREDSRFVITHPANHAGTVLGPRDYWDDDELADWVRLPDEAVATRGG